MRAEDAVADEQEFQVRIARARVAGGGDEVGVAFEMKEPARSCRRRRRSSRVAELAADAVAVLGRVQERLDFHAAVDGRELFARRDAGGDELVGHRVGDADDGVAARGGERFRSGGRTRGPARFGTG